VLNSPHSRSPYLPRHQTNATTSGDARCIFDSLPLPLRTDTSCVPLYHLLIVAPRAHARYLVCTHPNPPTSQQPLE
jgi:hypothetical protein